VFSTGLTPYSFSPRHQTSDLSWDTYRHLVDTISFRFPHSPVHCRADRVVAHNSIPLERSTVFFEYVIIDGKRYYASNTTGCNRSSLVHICLPGSAPNDAYGEILEIFQVSQHLRKVGHPLSFARVHWFKGWLGERDILWDELSVQISFSKFRDFDSHGPSAKLSTYVSGRLENTRPPIPIYRHSSIYTGSKVTLH
jgi:hypothetical protein